MKQFYQKLMKLMLDIEYQSAFINDSYLFRAFWKHFLLRALNSVFLQLYMQILPASIHSLFPDPKTT